MQQGKRRFLPISKTDLKEAGIDRLDFVFVTGDAYVDHPSFAHALLSRVLEANGYLVGILPQPDWRDPASICALGEPRLGFFVSSGNLDSMVSHYAVSKKRRSFDAYSPGGAMGKRPDRALIAYCKLIRAAYGKKPIVIGGIEASLRRLAHYDYWSDSLMRSILLDTDADLLSYGMGERSTVEIADALKAGIPVREITYVRGTVFRAVDLSGLDARLLPPFSELRAKKLSYAKSFAVQMEHADPFSGACLAEGYPDGTFVVQNPPQMPLTQSEMDRVYAYPYQRVCHPSYEALGGVPAISEVKFSLVSSRGCFGGCHFCALTFHQGRIVQARSHASLLAEAEALTHDPDFKGYIHDVGGPTANFRRPACKNQKRRGACPKKQCLFPKPCAQLEIDHSDYLSLLRKLRALPRVKKVFIRSGIRFDYLIADPDDTFFRELVQYHISGQLKVAPEHVCDAVLRQMGKPGHAVYRAFAKKFRELNEAYGMRQYLVPYLMSSHPGSTLASAVALAESLRDLGYMPEQVQDFYPTPSTLSTCMYYTGVDPRTMRPVYVPKSPHEKAMQRALIQYRNPKNYELVREALVRAGRTDLIGYGKHCLIRPEPPISQKNVRAGVFAKSGSAEKGTRAKHPKISPKGGSEEKGTCAEHPKISAKGGSAEKGTRAEHPKISAKGCSADRGAQRGAGARKKKTIRNVHRKKANS